MTTDFTLKIVFFAMCLFLSIVLLGMIVSDANKPTLTIEEPNTESPMKGFLKVILFIAVPICWAIFYGLTQQP
jgi:hypothetical protein